MQPLNAAIVGTILNMQFVRKKRVFKNISKGLNNQHSMDPRGVAVSDTI